MSTLSARLIAASRGPCDSLFDRRGDRDDNGEAVALALRLYDEGSLSHDDYLAVRLELAGY